MTEHSISSNQYELYSKKENKNLKVNVKIIDASTLLKNICVFTKISEPISVDCSSGCLETFIALINHYESISEVHDIEFERILYQNFTEDDLAKLVKEMSILDSDFFFDSVADLILDLIKDMDWKQMQEYLELEDDITQIEREVINKNLLEYLLSINVQESKPAELKFPFPTATNFISLKNKFQTPMNVLLSRIVKRSHGKTAFNLSLINKTLKNENDRHLIKVTEFHGSLQWRLEIDTTPRFNYLLSLDINDSNYFEEKYYISIKTRKIIAEERVSLTYQEFFLDEVCEKSSSFDFVVPKNEKQKLDVGFLGKRNVDAIKLIYHFNVEKCHFPIIIYRISNQVLDFKVVYNHLIAKDLSKQIELQGCEFDFYSNGPTWLYKKPNTSKFYKFKIIKSFKQNPSVSKFNEFIKSYIEDDGIMLIEEKIHGIDVQEKTKWEYVYKISAIKKYLDI